MRIEEIENGQQGMQEKLSQVTKMVTILIKGKGITEDPSSRDRPASWKNNDSQFAMPNPNDLCEQGKLRKNLSGRSKHINVQQKCNLLDKRLKVIESMDDLKSVDLRELCLVPDLVILPNFKMPTFEKYDGTKCLENHLVAFCHKMAGHAHKEDLLIHMFYDGLIGTTAQWCVKLKKEQICTWRDLARAFLE